MRVLLIILLIAIVAVALLVGFQHHSGYVIVHFSQTQMELSFWTAILGLLISFIVLYIIVRILVRLFSLGSYFKKRKTIRQAQNIKQLTEDGLVDAINGRWSSASNQLDKAASLSRNKLVPKLFCAFSAFLAGDVANRDMALSTIDAKNKDEHIAFQLAKAQMLMGSNDWEKAFSCLKTLHNQHPNHGYTSVLLAKACSQLHEWPLLAELLSSLKKNKAVNEEQYREWRGTCFKHRLQVAARQSMDMLTDTWKRGDRDDKSKLAAQQTYIEGLINLNEFDKAKSELASLLKKQWNPVLCASYEKFPDEQADELLHVVDKLCQQHNNDINCRKTLGILCCQAKRYVRAKEILTQVVSEKAGAGAMRALAAAHAAEGEWEQAAAMLQEAVSLR